MDSDLDYDEESDNGYSARSGSGSGSGSDVAEDMEEGEIKDPREAAEQLARVTGLTFCPTHKPGSMVEMCLTCRAVLALVRPEVAKELMIPEKATSAVHRYSARSDEQPPSLIMPERAIELAENVFNSGTYKNKGHWQDIVKKFLTLPPDQHERLVRDLEMEPMFRSYQSDNRFRHIFKYRKELGDALKMLRISQRVIFDTINTVDSAIPKIRSLGSAAGLSFPDVTPSRANPKVPKQLMDSLAVLGKDAAFAMPQFTDILEGVDKTNIPAEQLAQIERNWVVVEDEIKDYRQSMLEHYFLLFKMAAETANVIDDGFSFYVDLYGHVDASIRELLRSKMANLFKSEFRPGVLGKHKTSSSSRAKEKPLGLLGGEDKVRIILGEATKQDELLKKTLVPKSKPKPKAGGSSTRKRSRSRSRSPYRNRGKGNRSRQSGKGGNRNNGAKGGARKTSRQSRDDSEDESPRDSGAAKEKSKGKHKKSDNKSNKGVYFLPNSLATAWPSFFSTTAIMMVTAVGLVVDRIPSLDNLPLAGRISQCIEGWRKVCTNNWVCNVVEFGYKIPLKYVPRQYKVPGNPPVTDAAHKVLVDEAIGLKKKGAVSVVEHTTGEYISSYFAVPKPRSPGKFRPILNLKYFNKSVKKYKFKMETLSSVREWIREGAFCTGLDLKDAYPHIKIHQESRKFLRFVWLKEILQWDALPFGLTCSPRVLTKVVKPIIAFLRATWAILISVYMDDMLIQASSASEALLHTQLVMLVMMALGWSFNWEKSVLIPSQTVVHLGFVFDTESMTIACPKDKIDRLRVKSRKALQDGFISVHNLEKLLGTMESVRPATRLAALHYRSLQRQLISAKRFGRRPGKIIALSQKSILNLQWWVSETGFAGNCSSPIREGDPTLDIWSDANLTMGGARSSRGEFIQRAWNKEELSSNPHINVLEVRAAREGLALSQPGDIVRLHLDNRTACAYIRKQGGTRSPLLSREACLLWDESLARDVTLLAPHWLSTKDNVEADFLSRNEMGRWEFMLDKDLFAKILDTFQVSPTLDAFASRETAQLKRYMTWFQDPQAVASDALLHSWDKVTYLFPPVPLLLKVLQKVQTQKIRAVLICPQWPTALWWPLVVEMLVEPLLPLPHYKETVMKLDQAQVLPYLEPLVAAHISGMFTA